MLYLGNGVPRAVAKTRRSGFIAVGGCCGVMILVTVVFITLRPCFNVYDTKDGLVVFSGGKSNGNISDDFCQNVSASCAFAIPIISRTYGRRVAQVEYLPELYNFSRNVIFMSNSSRLLAKTWHNFVIGPFDNQLLCAHIQAPMYWTGAHGETCHGFTSSSGEILGHVGNGASYNSLGLVSCDKRLDVLCLCLHNV